MIVTTKCATRLKNLETTRLPRNIFGRLTAYILISRQIFFKNSQRSISKQRNAETAILTAAGPRLQAMKLVSRRQNDKNTDTFWKSRCVTSNGRLTFSRVFRYFTFKKEVVEEKTTLTTTTDQKGFLYFVCFLILFLELIILINHQSSLLRQLMKYLDHFSLQQIMFLKSFVYFDHLNESRGIGNL